jgi:hypothetical protein
MWIVIRRWAERSQSQRKGYLLFWTKMLASNSNDATTKHQLMDGSYRFAVAWGMSNLATDAPKTPG